MRLRDALAASPSGTATNHELAWGLFKVLSARQQPDGQIAVSWEEFAGEHGEGVFATAESASQALFGDAVTGDLSAGDADWEPVRVPVSHR